MHAALPAGTETKLTTAAGEATAIASAARDVEAIYVLGGDGTYNEVLNGVEVDVPLGFLPGGGTSVLPRALGLPRNPVRAAERVVLGRTRRIGLGRVNGRRFGFNAGLGFDAELVRKVDELGRSPAGRRPGDVAFMKVAAATLRERHGRFEEQVEIEGQRTRRVRPRRELHPYTYAGALALDLVPGADFDEGLAFFAPVTLNALDLPRLLLHGVRGKGLKDEQGPLGPRSRPHRRSLRSPAPAPDRRRGRGRRIRGGVRGGARRGHGACIVRNGLVHSGI